jgi:hypothetical protein
MYIKNLLLGSLRLQNERSYIYIYIDMYALCSDTASSSRIIKAGIVSSYLDEIVSLKLKSYRENWNRTPKAENASRKRFLHRQSLTRSFVIVTGAVSFLSNHFRHRDSAENETWSKPLSQRHDTESLPIFPLRDFRTLKSTRPSSFY